MSKSKILVVSANLGEMDGEVTHVPQTIEADYFTFTDENFPPREKTMTPRLQAKIPKCFAWQLKPGYDYYLWLDGNISLAKPDTLEHLYKSCRGHDFVGFQHYNRDTIYWEYRYNRRGLLGNATSNYLTGRYQGEFLNEQMAAIQSDKRYEDDLLLMGGVFMYRNNRNVRKALREWWYNITRYLVMDQLSFPYVLKKTGLKINVLDEKIEDWFTFVKRRRRI